jgi:hypothetical protein
VRDTRRCGALRVRVALDPVSNLAVFALFCALTAEMLYLALKRSRPIQLRGLDLRTQHRHVGAPEAPNTRVTHGRRKRKAAA